MNKQEKIITSFIGAIIGVMLIVFGGLWLYEKSFTLTIIKYSTFFNFFLTTIIALITFLYFLTTKRIVEKTSESLEITKERERIDRTLELLNKFNSDKFYSLEDKLGLPTDIRIIFPTEEILRKRTILLNEPGIRDEIAYFVDYFDTIAVFYFEGNLDKRLFETKLSDKFVGFIFNYVVIIEKIFKGNKKDVENILYWQKDFLRLAVEVLDEKRKIESKFKEFFEEYYNFYNNLLHEDKK